MRVMPIRYTADVTASVRFYTALGLDVGPTTRSGNWAEMPGAAGMLAIHGSEGAPGGECELAFESDEPVAEMAARMTSHGYTVDAVVDEAFGYSVRIQDPDGVWVQINNHDRELYT